MTINVILLLPITSLLYTDEQGDEEDDALIEDKRLLDEAKQLEEEEEIDEEEIDEEEIDEEEIDEEIFLGDSVDREDELMKKMETLVMEE